MSFNRERSAWLGLGVGIVSAAGLGGCAKTYSPAEFAALEKRVDRSLERLNEREIELQPAIDGSVGYAVFPAVGEFAIYGIGLALGDGLVFEQGEVLGVARYSELSAGLQSGGSAGTRVLIFRTPEALASLTDGELFGFGAESEVIGGSEGSGAATDFLHGVDSFRSPTGGLMFQAALKAGTYRYRPIEDAIEGR